MRFQKKRKEEYKEQIISLLKSKKKLPWTLEIAKEIGRDNDYIMKLMKELRDEGKVVEIKEGKRIVIINYHKRRKWKIMDAQDMNDGEKDE